MERAAPTRPLVGLRLQVSGKSGSSQLCEHGRKGAPRECGCAGRWGGPELTRLHQSDHTYSYSYKGSSHCLCNSRDHRQQTLTAQSTPRSVLVTLSRNRMVRPSRCAWQTWLHRVVWCRGGGMYRYFGCSCPSEIAPTSSSRKVAHPRSRGGTRCTSPMRRRDSAR